MGQVTFKLEAEEAKAVQAFMKVVEAQNKTEKGAKRVTQAGRETQGAMSGAGDVGSQKILSLIGPLASVGSALALLRADFQAWNQEMEQIGQTARKFTTDLVQTVSDSGDLAKLPELRKYIENNLKGGMTLEQATQTYGAVRGALPTESFDKMLEVTGKAMESRLTGTDPVQFGMVMGELSKIFPDKSADDLADLTKAVTETAGRHGKRFGKAGVKAAEQFVAAGLGAGEEGLAFTLASFEAGQGAEGALGIIQKLREQRKMPPRNPFGKKESAEQQRLRAYYSADSKERMELLQNSPEMRGEIFGTQAAVYEAMMARDPEGIRKQLLEAQSGNLFEKSKRMVTADVKAETVQKTDAIRAAAEQYKEKETGLEALEDEEVLSLIELEGLRRGARPLVRNWERKRYKFFRWLGASKEGSLPLEMTGTGDFRFPELSEISSGEPLEYYKPTSPESPTPGAPSKRADDVETKQNTKATGVNTEAIQELAQSVRQLNANINRMGGGGQLNPNAQTE